MQNQVRFESRLNSSLRELDEAKSEVTELRERGNALLNSNDAMHSELANLRQKDQTLEQDKSQLLQTLQGALREGNGFRALVANLQREASEQRRREDERVRIRTADLVEQAAKERLNMTAQLAKAKRVNDAEQTEIVRLRQEDKQLSSLTAGLRGEVARLETKVAHDSMPALVRAATQDEGQLRDDLAEAERKAFKAMRWDSITAQAGNGDKPRAKVVQESMPATMWATSQDVQQLRSDLAETERLPRDSAPAKADDHDKPQAKATHEEKRRDDSGRRASADDIGNDLSELGDLAKLNAGIARAKRELAIGTFDS